MNSQASGSMGRLRVPTISLATPALLEPPNFSSTGRLSATLNTLPSQISTTRPKSNQSFQTLTQTFTQTLTLARVSQTKQEVRNLSKFFSEHSVIPAASRRTLLKESTQEDWVPFCVTILFVDGIPQAKEHSWSFEDEEEEGVKIEYEIRLHLFDLTYTMFFGRSWVGPRRTIKKGAAQNTRLQCNVPVYFHTSLADPNIVIVIEIVRVTVPKLGKAQHMSSGWGILRIFQQGDFTDTSHSTPAPVKRVDLFHGSPRALFFLGDDIEGNKKLTIISECQFCYTIRTHRYMDKIMHLLPENVLVGGNELIPGVTVVDPKDGGDSLRRPKPMKQVQAVIDKLSLILYPNIDQFEEDLCKHLNSDRLSMEHVQTEKSSVVVSERRLQIGVHNGWGYISKPQILLLDTSDSSMARGGIRGSMKKTKSRQGSAESRENLGSALLVKNKITLPYLVDSPSFAIVFFLEYIVSMPTSTQDKKLSVSMNRAQTQTVALRWGAWTPSFKESTSEVSIQLQGGALPNPDNMLVYKNLSAELSDKEMAKLAAGKLQFVFKSKRPGGSRPISPMSTEPSLLKGRFPSAASLPSVTTATDQASIAGDIMGMVSGRPPMPRSPRVPSRGQSSPIGHAPIQPMNLQPSMAYPQHGSQPITNQYGHMTASQPPGSLHPTGQYTSDQYQGRGQTGTQSLYPMEIKHMEVGTVSNGDQLEELPYTPVHAPIMPVGPYHTSGPGLSRASYAHLYQAGFVNILDRQGEVPEVVDPSDHVILNPERENKDLLQCNEIVVRFLAVSRMLQFQQSVPSDSPRTVFFTFQFYRYPPVTTERLLLGNVEGNLTADSHSLPCVLKKMKNDGKKNDEPPGWTVRYTVDPSFLKPGEGRLFVKYLYQQTLHVDVWDGDSLLLLGSCAVELKHLLRCGREAVQITHELDVITTEYGEDANAMTGDLMRSGSVRPVGVKAILKGRLHLQLANVGHRVDVNVMKAGTMPVKAAKVVVQEDGSGAFLGGSVNLGTRPSGLGLANLRQKRSYMASHMVETDKELASSLLMTRKGQIDQTGQATGREADSKKQRKLARMQAIRQAQNNDTNKGPLSQSLLLKKEEKVQRTRDLKTIEIHRDRMKKDGILSMLQSAITTEHIVHPTFGQAEFFEFVLRNPYNVQHTISIQWDEPELSVITDPREWRHFKQLFETYTAIEENMFNQDKKTDGDVPGLQLFLRPKETVNVPFKYQSFKANHAVQPQGPQVTSKPHFKIQLPEEHKEVDLALDSRNVRVYFKTQDNKPIAILSLNVEPQPHVIDQTFRFNHPEQSFLKKSIRLPPFHSTQGLHQGGGAVGQLFVKCSDENAICETKRVPPGEPQDVYVKVACGLSPSIKKLFILIYSTPFLSRPLQTWQFYIHALQRVDVSCVQGQTSRQSLILRGTHASRLVQSFSSHPNEMQLLPSEPFMLLANSVHEIHVGVRPLSVGNKFMYINVVDNEYHQLIRSWLVCVQCRQPVISKAFELQLPVGGGKGSNKRITYTNPYPHHKVFNIRCNRDDLLQFKETRVQIDGGETYGLGLRFSPCQQAGSAEILIFINDEQDNNEETFLVRAIYS
ncbi:nephrocystin-4-like isoform X2 [Asterias rubens]|uniref:nephrocystin-4-like isoform X2 n=1 Tax=Asterias rubens TaxID=7604 RepID=UPI0014551BCC|nr:nephrocystin-4-like isoform X2 [Asterias rubens]